MTEDVQVNSVHPQVPADRRHYWHLFRQTLARMLLLYFMPLLLLAAFFYIQYGQLLSDSMRAHLEVIAEYQANTFDLFLRERLVNLSNIIDDPSFAGAASDVAVLESFLEELRHTSEAFVDLGYVTEDGRLVSYVGPIDFPDPINYENEGWFQQLLPHHEASVITEVYLGFRGKPHFTIAVKRERGGVIQILRSTLTPEWLSTYLANLEGGGEVHAAIVSGSGIQQVTTPQANEQLKGQIFVPPRTPQRGYVKSDEPGKPSEYAYAWLRETPWALVVTDAGTAEGKNFVGSAGKILPYTVAFIALGGLIILARARSVTGTRLAVEQHEASLSGQLVHAARLASVGELASGIAHEINNPLAIIAEEAGVLKDALDPALADEEDEQLDSVEHLDIISDAVFRCRDITRKLLTFVRQTDAKLEAISVHEILDGVLDGMLGNELAISNIRVFRRYDERIGEISTDRTQLVQVLVNLVKNAIDAMPAGGMLTVRTVRLEGRIAVYLEDTGCGMTPEQLECVFMPFFTTKDPGHGTGLGLSVSNSIIEHLGGRIYAESSYGKGSTFTIELPLDGRKSPTPRKRGVHI